VGATKPHHLQEAVDAVGLELTDEEVQGMEAPYQQYGPSWYQRITVVGEALRFRRVRPNPASPTN
jgi:diketogulonate reductase-like aldo/keto reductase